MVSKKKAAAGGLTVGAMAFLMYYFNVTQLLLNTIETMGLWTPPKEVYGVLSLCFLIGYIYLQKKDKESPQVTMLGLSLVGADWAQFGTTFNAQLWDYTPKILAFAIAYLTWELSKKGARGLATRIGEKSKTKWALGVYAVLFALLSYTLWLQGYLTF